MKWLTRRAERRTTNAVAPPAPADVPCVPCQEQEGVRPFSIRAPIPVPVTEDDVPHHVEGVPYAVIDGAVLLYDTGHAVSHALNPTAALIWASVGDGATVTEIIDELTTATGRERREIAAAVTATLSRLVDSGVVRLHDVTPAADPPATAWSAARRRLLDQQPWTTTFGPVRAAAATVEVRTNSSALGPTLESLLGSLPAVVPETTDADDEVAVVSILQDDQHGTLRYRVYRDGAPPVVAHDAVDVQSALNGAVNLVATQTARGRLLLHAGAVEIDGLVVVIAGDSRRGKSTLTARLVQRGARYVTDEVAAIDPATHVVLPFPRPLSLHVDAAAALSLPAADVPEGAKVEVTPTAFGEVSAGGRVALLVLLNEPEVRRGTTQPEGDATATDTTAADAEIGLLVDLLACTFLASFQDPDALDHLLALTRRVPVRRLRRTELDAMCDEIEAALAAVRAV